MKYFNSDKPIYTINMDNYDYNLRTSKRGIYYNYIQLIDVEGLTIYPEPCTNPAKAYDAATKGTLNSGDSLFFTKDCKFPRFKLLSTDYKRVIKLDKADAVIVSSAYKYQQFFDSRTYDSWSYGVSKINSTYLCECDECILLVPINYRNKFSSNDAMKRTIIADAASFEKKLTNLVVPDKPANYWFLNKTEEPMLEVLNGTYSGFKVLTDKALDGYVNSNLPVMTDEDVKTMMDMFGSSDQSVVTLAMKMLMGFDTTATPLTTRALLYSYVQNWTSCSAKNSVGFKRILDSANINNSRYNDFPRFLQYLDKNLAPTALDCQLTKIVLTPLFVKEVERTNNQVEGSMKRMKGEGLERVIPKIKIIVK